MKSVCTLFSFLLVSCGATMTEENPVAKEMETLAGSWKLISIVDKGTPVPEEKLPAISFTLQPDGISTVQTPDGEFQTRSIIHPSKSPKTLDIEYLGGLLKGKKQYGIYKVDGDRWTVFSTPPGGELEDRPEEFDTNSVNGTLIVWERVKE